ncbi:MAG: PAS domain S-box protein [Deltaproteobacteria bacterium]|nr:PAS domain S-box protein [Deltaproteobacteria bacterium]
MLNIFSKIRRRLVSKLILTVGFVFLFSITTWAYFNIDYQKEKLMQNIVNATDRLTSTIRLGTHYAMMLNSRDDINQIITNIGKQPEIKHIRIYNKSGEIKYSNHASEVNSATNIKAEACNICHRSKPPLTELALNRRTRFFNDPSGERLLGIISPIRNEPGCAEGCHVHPENKKILGALDLVVSLKETDREIIIAQRRIFVLAFTVFLLTSIIILVFVLTFVNRPIKKLIEDTRLIAQGKYPGEVEIDREDEMGQLAAAIHQMSEKIAQKQAALNQQRDEYMDLFQRVPCLITVQDRSFKLIRYNQEFADKFDPQPGEHCYEAYKGRSEKCRSCPVEKTFSDGQSYSTEETGVDKDGSIKHWIVRSSPIFNEKGDIVAAMEISLDITARRLLEVELEQSEKKYHAIFNNIPNPVFVLDQNNFEILDSNNSVATVYGYTADEIRGRTFLELFRTDETEHYAFKLRTASIINQARHIGKDGKELFVNIRMSPSEYSGQRVLLVTTSDITKRLETEQQLIQASKMATLGEMATGVAHELNQPLSVIKTASSFLVKKLNTQQPIAEQILATMLEKVDGNVDRATKIINHMRQFARKSDVAMEKVDVHSVLESAFEIFSQQLKVRGIEILREFSPDLPRVKADPGRLEQVFINLLLNARDAIEERCSGQPGSDQEKSILLKTYADRDHVTVEICDTGVGIPPDIVEKVFEPFFTTKEVGRGTGLGLSISYGIVKDCGGEIMAVPNRGRGTCFRLVFPALKPPAQPE